MAKKRKQRKPRNTDVLGIIRRGGKGIHAGQSTADLREAKAPPESDWDGIDNPEEDVHNDSDEGQDK